MGLKLTYHYTDKIQAYDANSRTHSDHQVSQIAASIMEFGFTNPILIDENQTVIAGHGRLAAAQKLGIDKVPTIVLSGLTDNQKKAYVIADNKLALNAGWNYETLKAELSMLEDNQFDVNIIGFNPAELAELFSEGAEQTNAYDEWEGMPEFDQPDATSWKQITVHFESDEHYQAFCGLIGQSLTPKTKSIWFPAKERNDTESQRYG